MTQDLRERDVALAVLRELGNMLGDAVGEAQRAVLHQRPDAGRRNHLGIRKQQPQRVGVRRARGVDRGSAKTFEQREPAVSRERDLRTRIAALGDVAFDQPAQTRERGLVETELGGACLLERIA